MARRTETKIAVLIQVMDELGFDRETITKVTRVPQRTVSDIINGKGSWTFTGEFNETSGVVQALLEKIHPRRIFSAWAYGFGASRGTDKRRRFYVRLQHRQHGHEPIKNRRWEIRTVENQEKYLSTWQLMDFLEISRSTVYRLMAKGMPNIMVGSVYRFPMNQVVVWLENRRGNKQSGRGTLNAEI